jgi:hypothetical protein
MNENVLYHSQSRGSQESTVRRSFPCARLGGAVVTCGKLKPDAYIEIGIGALGSLLAAGAIGLAKGIGEFLPRNLDDLGIGSSFEAFRAQGPGDRYKACLWLRFRNHGSGALFIVRCVYENRHGLPVYINASLSQKYRRAYEVKFGEQWHDLSILIPPKTEITSYVPLSLLPPQEAFPPHRRGRLLIEYVYNGRTGRHRAGL